MSFFNNLFGKIKPPKKQLNDSATVLSELKAYSVDDKDIIPNNIYVKTAVSITKNIVGYKAMYCYMAYAESKNIQFSEFLYFVVKKFKDVQSLADAISARLALKESNRAKLFEKIQSQSSYTSAEIEKYIKKLNIPLSTFYMMEYHLLSKKELKAVVKKVQKENEAKIDKVLKSSGMTKEQMQKHMRYCYEVFGIDEDSYFDYSAWEVDDDVLSAYLTNGMSRCLRAYYNTSKGNRILSNKNLFKERYAKFFNRDSWESSSKDFESFKAFVENKDRIIIKPLSLMSGKGIRFVDIDDKTDVKELFDSIVAGPNVLVEEVIKQHHKMAEVYPNSINTVRLVTLQVGDEVNILTGFVRFGVEGNVDNFGAGGVSCRIDVETGEITSKAVGRSGEYFERHPVSNVEFKGFKIPLWNEVRRVATEAIKEHSFVDYVGWDIAICEDKVVIVEGNSWPGIDTGRQNNPEFPGRRHLFDGLTPF